MIHSFTTPTDGANFLPPNNAPIGLDNLSDQGFQVDDPTSPDMSFVENIVNEMFSRSAIGVFVYPRTRNEDINETNDEDPDPTYWNPVSTKAYFSPQPMEFELTRWGVDSKNQLEPTFLRSNILDLFGDRLLQPGDLIQVPYRSLSEQRPKYYRVVNAQESGMYRYQWFYIKCQATLIPGEITIRPPTDENLNVNDFPRDL